MAFTNDDILKIAAATLASGTIDSSGSQWYEKRNSWGIIVDPESIWSDMEDLKLLPAATYQQAVNNSVTNPELIGRVGINADGTYNDTTAIRMTKVAGTNGTTYITYNTYQDPESGVRTNWLQPQLIPQASGAASAQYQTRIFMGPPSQGNLLFSSAGFDGEWVSHFWSPALGLLMISPADKPPSPAIPDDDLYAVGFIYTGKTGSGSDVGDKYVESYLNKNITVGDKFTNYNGVICIKNHIGKWPMDIFDGNWKRIGDDRMFRFEGTEQQKLTRLLPSYSQSSPVDLSDSTTVFATTTNDPLNSPVGNIFYPSLKQENGAYTVEGGWHSQVGQITKQRVYYDTGTLQVLNGLFYVNGLGDVGSQRVTVYTSKAQPVHNQWGANEGLVQRYDGTLEFRPPEEENTSKTNHITFTDDISEYQWIIIDIATNYGGDSTSIQWLQPYQGIAGVSVLPPVIGAFTKYEPVWGDNGNQQGRVILNVNVGGNGATEWAYSDVDNLPTLHFRERDVLADRNGELVLFEANVGNAAILDIGEATSSEVVNNDLISIKVNRRNTVILVNLGRQTDVGNTGVLSPNIVIDDPQVYHITLRVTDTNGYCAQEGVNNFFITLRDTEGNILGGAFNTPLTDLNQQITLIRNLAGDNTRWIRIN